MGKSPGAGNRDRSPKSKGDASATKRRTAEPHREAGEAIPPAGKTKARTGSKAGGGIAPGRGTAIGKPCGTKGGAAGSGEPAGGKKVRLPPRKAFLVAATLAQAGGMPNLRVYAAVVRGAEAALAAVRAEIGDEAAVELTGSLSTRMAKTLGLKPDEIRQI